MSDIQSGNENSKVFIASNGCDRRLLDSQKLDDFFRADNYKIIKDPARADFIFVNTCAMSLNAEDTSVNLIKKYLSLDAKLIVHGCLPQIAPERFHKEFNEGKIIKIDAKDLNDKMDELFPSAKLKFSKVPDPTKLANDQGLISKILNKVKFNEIFYLTCLSAIKFKLRNPSLPLHPRVKVGAYLQVSSGCSDSCTYCAIPRAIGNIKSKDVLQIGREYARLLEKGENRFVFTADNLGLYGLENKSSLPELLDELASIDKHYRKVIWTFNELHPKWAIKYQESVIKYVIDEKIQEICIPIQSGNDRILSLMKRNYVAADLLEFLLKLRKASSKVRITSDVIIGFPTETDEEFLETIRLIAKVKFDQVMFFSYSPREGTQAKSYEYNEKENSKRVAYRFKMAMKLLDSEKISYTFQ